MPWCTDSISNDYLSPTRINMASGREASHEDQRGTVMEKYGTVIPQITSPPRVEIPFFQNEEATRKAPNSSNSSDHLPTRTPPQIPLTPSTPDSSSLFDTTELFDEFPSVPQNLPTGPGTSLLRGFELRTNSDMGFGGGLGKAATISSSYRSASQSYR